MAAAPETRRRTCVGCGARRPPGELVRFRVAAGRWTTGGEGGRSAYACPDPACLLRAMRRGGLQRGLRGHGPQLESAAGLGLAAGALVDKAARLLGFGARARTVAVGREAIAAALGRRRTCAILLAEDAGGDASAWAAARAAAGIPVIRFPSKRRLGAALGRAEAALAGVCDTALATGIVAYLRAAERLAGAACPPDSRLALGQGPGRPTDGGGGE